MENQLIDAMEKHLAAGATEQVMLYAMARQGKVLAAGIEMSISKCWACVVASSCGLIWGGLGG